MGMAAGQARLLSITSRMSDNELRAQIINNQKMRLATQSSQVSEAYVNALNQAQMMFTNYDADNNQSYQQLTYNSLTAYNPYNNQYALVNASGNVLVTEDMAKSYMDADGDLEKFLAGFGLEQTTTYFDELSKYTENPIISDDGKVMYDPAKHEGQVPYMYTDEVTGEVKYAASGYTAEQLKVMFFGGKEASDTADINHFGYNEILTSDFYNSFQGSLYRCETKYNAYLSKAAAKMEQVFTSTNMAGDDGIVAKLQACVTSDPPSAIGGDGDDGTAIRTTGLKMLALLDEEYTGYPLTVPVDDTSYDLNTNHPQYELIKKLFLGAGLQIDNSSGEIVVGTYDASNQKWQYNGGNKLSNDELTSFQIGTLSGGDDGKYSFVNATPTSETSKNDTIIMGDYAVQRDKNGNYYLLTLCEDEDGNEYWARVQKRTKNGDGTYSSTDMVIDADAGSVYIAYSMGHPSIYTGHVAYGTAGSGNNSAYFDGDGTASDPYDSYGLDKSAYADLRTHQIGFGASIEDFTNSILDTINNNNSSSDYIDYDENGQAFISETGASNIQNAAAVKDQRYDLHLGDTAWLDRADSTQILYECAQDINMNYLSYWDALLPRWAEDGNGGYIQEYKDFLSYAGTAMQGLVQSIQGYTTTPENGTVTFTLWNNKTVTIKAATVYDILNNPETLSEIAKSGKLQIGVSNNNPVYAQYDDGSGIAMVTTETDEQNMQNIADIIILDNIMNTYGEPQMSWIDVNDKNANGQAKYEWYSNLFSRMQQGFTVIQDGLASSNEWIQFALENGLATLEQVDSEGNWNGLSYANCSDITERTNDQAVTIAEAEYNAAMNKIENKDKKYDLELKNIDTEHNSLQTEYDSIKSAIDKNIERTFKIYS